MTATSNPFVASPPGDADDHDPDRDLVAGAQAGDGAALEELVRRHQPWVHNLALRMLYHPHDAEDATQEILVKVVTRLATFEGRSRLRTWLYRIAVNHLRNVRRSRAEAAGTTFAQFAQAIEDAPDLDLPDPKSVPVDVGLLVDEARIGCTTGMLLCLDREQRLAYVLGGVLGATDVVAAAILEIEPAAYRKRLSRARADLHAFMAGVCGLVDPANPCRCHKKTRAFIDAGYVDPQQILFANERVQQVKDVAGDALAGLDELDRRAAEVHRETPFASGPDVASRLASLLDGPEWRRWFAR